MKIELQQNAQIRLLQIFHTTLLLELVRDKINTFRIVNISITFHIIVI